MLWFLWCFCSAGGWTQGLSLTAALSPSSTAHIHSWFTFLDVATQKWMDVLFICKIYIVSPASHCCHLIREYWMSLAFYIQFCFVLFFSLEALSKSLKGYEEFTQKHWNVICQLRSEQGRRCVWCWFYLRWLRCCLWKHVVQQSQQTQHDVLGRYVQRESCLYLGCMEGRARPGRLILRRWLLGQGWFWGGGIGGLLDKRRKWRHWLFKSKSCYCKSRNEYNE